MAVQTQGAVKGCSHAFMFRDSVVFFTSPAVSHTTGALIARLKKKEKATPML